VWKNADFHIIEVFITRTELWGSWRGEPWLP